MNIQELDTSTSTSRRESNAPAASNPTIPSSYANIYFASVLLFVTLFVLLAIVSLAERPTEWIEYVLAGLITGFTLGTVFGLWIARSLGYDPKPKKFLIAAGIVLSNSCVGFFGFSYYTSASIWPEANSLYGSIATASIFVSGAMLCLVNFFWHSRDQKRIHTLRSVLTKNRAKMVEAETRAAVAERRAEEAERQSEEQRKEAEQARLEAEQARATAQGSQQSAQQAQRIAEKEKRCRSNQALLPGRWQCIEYATRPRTSNPASGLEILKELEKNKDIFFFAADGQFTIDHPGTPTGLLDKIMSRIVNEPQVEADIPEQKTGRWKLDESGEIVLLELANGTRRTLKIRAITATTMTIDKSTEQLEVLRFLVKI